MERKRIEGKVPFILYEYLEKRKANGWSHIQTIREALMAYMKTKDGKIK